MPAAERQIALSLSELEVQGKSNSTICIKWSPKEAGNWRDVLQLTDSRRIKYDIVIATTAKDNKKNYKTKKRLPKSYSSLLKTSNLSVSTTNKQFNQNNTLKIPTISQPLIPSLDAQAKQCKLRNESNLNKENIFNNYNETETSSAIQGKDERINGTYHNHGKSDNIMFEQNINVWNNESILPQVFPTNEPQDIRRVTYVKERRPCSNVLHECNIIEDTDCDNDKVHSDISVLLNKFTFTPVDVISSSPESMKRELAESTSFSQSTDNHRTFDISRSHLFETSATYDTKTLINVPSQPIGLHNLSPIKSDRCSLITDIKDLIASSPIAQYPDMSKDSNEYLKHIKVKPSVQITNHEYLNFEIISKNIETTKKIGDVYIEISPPKKHFHSKMISMPVPKLNSTRTGRITKNKTLCEGGNSKKLQLNIPVASKLFF